MSTATIYALCDSRESDPVARVRYVGVTTRTVAVRLKQHYAAAKAGDQTHRGRWMRSLIRQGVPITAEVLEVVPQSDCDAAEQRWIVHYGYQTPWSRLCNHSAGGGGPLNPDEETRAKMRRAAVARMAIPTVRARLSEAAKAQWLAPDARARFTKASRAGWTEVARAGASASARQRWVNRDAEDKARTVAQMDTPRARALTRQRSRGRKNSSDTRAKQSRAARAWWATVGTRRTASGDRHGMAKLTWSQVRQIRRRLCTEGVSHSQLAREFNIGRTAIHSIATNKTWVEP
jgi:hypothetical protein